MQILEKFNLSGMKMFVTGAGRGIGQVIATALCSAGADVAFVDLDPDTVQVSAQKAAELTGANTIAIQADVSKPESVNAMMESILAKFGWVDAAFNNAGIANADMPAEDIPYDLINQILQVNVIGVYLCCQACAKVMIPRKKGSIINMASMSAHIVNVPQKTSNYAVSKAGVVTLTKNLAAEWAPHNVRVNCISPGYTMTELAKQFESQFGPWLERIPMGRFQQPEELAGAVVYLASDASTYTTGTDIIIDGGYSLW
ncbi:MAG: SDR family oxidoreductase [Eubacteriales bacterium]